MATETDTQTARIGSKRAQLNRERRENANVSRVPEGQMAGGGANLTFDNAIRGASDKEDSDKKQNENSLVRGGGDRSAEAGNKGLNYRRVMAQEKKKQKKKADKKKKMSPTYQGSKKALSMAWRSLIPSWLTTIFIIDLFAFLHVVFPKFFCSLGEEWESPMSAVAGDKEGSSNKSAMMKSVEPMIVILINLVVLGVIAVILASLALVVEAISDPIGFVGSLMGDLWESLKSAFGG
ncbi:MAG TPA: hypothetical protein VJ926_03075 [Patescibacteria group bacterium]|nr:hypothetical protein [Patescibacteria group bacterium]